MAEPRIFTLPDVGEGLAEARVERFLVAEGDLVTNLQALVEVETDKAMVELTSPWAGVISSLLVEPGDWVEVGGGLLAITVDER